MLCNFAVYFSISLIFWPKFVPSILIRQEKFEQNWLKNKWDINVLVKPIGHVSELILSVLVPNLQQKDTGNIEKVTL